MKKTFKRVLSLLMVLVLVCSVLPVSHVHAEGQYTVTVMANDTLVDSATVDGTYTLPDFTLSIPEGYTFFGWATDEIVDSTTLPSVIAVGTQVTVSENVTYYAVLSYSDENASSTSYVLVTNKSQLAIGSKCVIAAAECDYALSTTQNSNNRAQVAITKNSNNTLELATGVAELTLGAGNTDGTYSFHDDNGYLYAASSSKNYLRSEANLSDNSSFTISVTPAGVATVTAQGTNTRNILQYNQTSGLFSCYSSAQKDIALYIETTSQGVTYFTTTWEKVDTGCQHTNAYTVEEIPATCTADGYTAGEFCPDCKTYLSGHEVIEALGHSLDAGVVTTDATCTTEGVKTYTCTREGCDYTETEAIPATGHDYVDGVCSVCGQKAPQYIKVALSELSAQDTVIIVATNSENASYAMSNDKAASDPPTAVSVEIENNIITTDATNILWNIACDSKDNLTIYPAGTTVTWLYCTNGNNGVRVGTNANKIFTLDASGYLKNTATSRYLGVYSGQDWRCYTTYTTDNIANQTFSFYKLACQHTDTAEVEAIAATCTEAGHAAGTICTICGAYVSGGEEIPALGHSWNDGVITKEATCTVNGTKTYTCTVCSATKTETVAAPGHIFEVVGDDYVCSVCRHSEPTAETLTIAEAIALANSMANNTFTVHKYSVTGVVTEVYNTKYGNMYITDGNGNTLTIYGTSSADGSVEYDKMDVKPAAGDTVTVYGVVGQYKGPEMKDVWLMEHTVKPVDQWNITLKDDLNVNFYMNLNADDQVQVTVGEEAVTYNATALQTTEDGKYIVTVEMAAAQMMDAITIQIVGSNAAPETYTIRQYADTVLADDTKSAYHALVKEMLNYGAMAQVYFDHNATNLANAGIEGFGTAEVTEATYETTIYEGTVDGISFYSASLVYGSKVAVRLYFKVLSGSIEDYTFSTVLADAETGIEANVLTPVAKGDYYYIEFADITPDKWNEAVNLYVIKGEQNIHVQYSPLSYMARMSGKATSGDALKNLLKAMYNYHLAAKNLVVV